MSRKQREAPRGVVDTSVVIAGAAALRGSPLSPSNESGRFILRWIEKGHFEWLYSEDILDEYKEVMKRCGVRPSVVGRFINLLREEGVKITVRRTAAISPDPGDDPMCAVSEAGNATFIVTLNPRDFPQRKLRAKVIRPSQQIPSGRRATE